MRASLAFLASYVFALGCSEDTPPPPPAPAELPSPPATAVSTEVGDHGLGCTASPAGELPAGMYFRTTGFYLGSLLEFGFCAVPRVAVVYGVYPDLDTATRGLREVREDAALPLAVGYPWVVHTLELGLPDTAGRGIAVVLGVFASARAADAWVAARSEWTGRARVVPILGDEEALAKIQPAAAGTEYPQILQIDARAAVPVYPMQGLVEYDVDGVPGVPIDRGTPLCTLVPGSLISTSPTQRQEFDLGSLTHDWQPAPCPTGIGVVKVTDTTRASVTWRHADGSAHRSQVVLVECDVATIMDWLFVNGHRVGFPRRVSGSCGAAEEPPTPHRLRAFFEELAQRCSGPEGIDDCGPSQFAATFRRSLPLLRRHRSFLEDHWGYALRRGYHTAAYGLAYLQARAALPDLREQLLSDRTYYGWESSDVEDDRLADHQFPHHEALASVIEHLAGTPLRVAIALTDEERDVLRQEVAEAPEPQKWVAAWLLTKL